MKRVITAKAKNGEAAVTQMTVNIKMTMQYLTTQEAKQRVEFVKNSLNDFLRVHGSFNQSDIKIS